MHLNGSTIFAIIAAAIAFRVVLYFIDKNRIQREVEDRGGRIVSISWNPFARGWFFEKGRATLRSHVRGPFRGHDFNDL
jgi:hypothetical protein